MAKEFDVRPPSTSEALLSAVLFLLRLECGRPGEMSLGAKRQRAETLMYELLGAAVAHGDIEPEEARRWELYGG